MKPWRRVILIFGRSKRREFVIPFESMIAATRWVVKHPVLSKDHRFAVYVPQEKKS